MSIHLKKEMVIFDINCNFKLIILSVIKSLENTETL